jgi:pimeloyl-ACP methyl ester carboxylesterase
MPPTIVLLHGAALNRRMWDPIVQALEPEFRVVTTDLPGHGANSDRPFQLDAAVAQVRELIRRDAPTGVVLGGDSLGGYVSMAVAAARPKLITGLVLSGATKSFRGFSAIAAHLEATVVGSIAALMGSERLLARVKTQVRLAYPRASAEAFFEGGIRMAARNEALRELAGRDFLTPLAACRAPILVINGERDRPCRKGEPEFLRCFPQAHLEIIAGSPHGASLWDPPGFAHLIRTWIHHAIEPVPQHR